MNDKRPAEVFPVGHFVKEEMEARGWTLEDLLNHMPGERKVNELWVELILADPELFDADTRINLRLGDPAPLAQAFGTSTELWANLDNAWHDHQNRNAG